MNPDIYRSMVANLTVRIPMGSRPLEHWRDQKGSNAARLLRRVNIALSELGIKSRYRTISRLIGREITSTYQMTYAEAHGFISCAYPAVAQYEIDPSFGELLKDLQWLDPFAVIYADPPWNFRVRSDKGLGRTPKYPKLDTQQMMLLPVQDVAAKNAVLLMWTTWPFMKDAIALGESWGFTYKTAAFVWAKNTLQSERKPSPIREDRNWKVITGYWTRGNTEPCLLFTRGNPSRMSKAVRQLVVEPTGNHSAKPLLTYERIEDLLRGPYLELFARNERPGWISLGNDLDGRDIRDSLPALAKEIRRMS